MDGDSAMVEKLISAGAEVDAANKNGCGWGQLCGFGDRGDGGSTALHLATLLRHNAVVEKLISARAKVDVADEYSNTALHFAAATGDTALVQQLISAGAKVGAADRNGETPLL